MSWIPRSELEALSDNDREPALAALRAAIDARLAPLTDWEAFWPEARVIIEELRAAGHDLWSIEYDGTSLYLWGYDYMRPETAGRLQIQFDFGGDSHTFWRGVDDRIGVKRPGER